MSISSRIMASLILLSVATSLLAAPIQENNIQKNSKNTNKITKDTTIKQKNIKKFQKEVEPIMVETPEVMTAPIKHITPAPPRKTRSTYCEYRPYRMGC